jgi:DNA-3-methyladenine glycosylase
VRPEARLEGEPTAARRLGRHDFNRPTLAVARGLLGMFVVHATRGRRVAAMIVETEAYKGPRDRASHASGGRRTPRVEPLYADGGTVYVYLAYGLHWLLNFSTAGCGRPEGVLVRGILPAVAGAQKPILGPGRVTRHLQIDKAQDGVDATVSTRIWLEDRGERVPPGSVRTGPRIGVSYAGAYWAGRPWRYWIDIGSLAGSDQAPRFDTRPGRRQ